MRQAYITKNFREASWRILAAANHIIEEYQDKGFKLTLRQLYYQFVARDLLPNTIRSYKKLGNIVNDGRLAGYLDWDAIEDRTRNLVGWRDDESVEDALLRLSSSFSLEHWDDQEYYVEVWVEKEALAGIFEDVCGRHRIPFFACRGYVSQSEMRAAAVERFIAMENGGKQTVILHFGDHDPSGIDMTRDIEDRMELFGSSVQVIRKALNMDQVDEYNPPPNPAKTTDARFAEYLRMYGSRSWELDALDPEVLSGLVRDAFGDYVDLSLWDASRERQAEGRRQLRVLSDRYDEVVEHLDSITEDE